MFVIRQLCCTTKWADPRDRLFSWPDVKL